MDTDFWHERWQRGEIGFHKSKVNPLLVRWWPALQLSLGSAVWVPLCGKSLDLLWLHDQGHIVVGVELSRSALDDFALENQLTLTWRRQEPFDLAEGQGLKLFAGDVFALQSAQLEQVVAVYDRAALIALPPAMRARYAAHIIKNLPAGWQMLLVTLDYPQAERAGPPFSVADTEVRQLFKGCSISLLDECDVLADHAVFRQQGMTRLHERVYHIKAPVVSSNA
ncbi:thiopurine S-methyltransferase [Halopseudomonas pelagia]|uniref:thiopurine S-methyltransferase n=1 Tax=Halopseudomonas pelagia TaxID=553151 RepID=UPI00039C8DD5|nr:thiopurine S-methyltransferase [Halopseudomonas pelagia]